MRRLGEAECRDCGNVGDPATASSATEIAATAGEGMSSPGLAEEVEQAIAKVLRPKTRPAPIR
ncbi:MAG TPA: hypothetical protein VJT16_06280 [Streptosporangiaceae bacterium]|nr:hypothetical protein [Streptosporangiaceae bacterium]